MRNLKITAAFLLFFSAVLLPALSARAYAAMPTKEEMQEELKEDGEILKGDDKKKKKKKVPIPPIDMVLLKGGCFQMGDRTGDGDDDERPVHEVCLTDFYMQTTEVTQELFEAVMGYNPSKITDPKKPVVGLSWHEAISFVKMLNAEVKGYYRLPYEAEWEYAARSGGKDDIWSGTNNEGQLDEYAWFSDNSEEGMNQVKRKKPNGAGLYDMSGNVWEWTEDFFDFDYYKVSPRKDPYGADVSLWKSIRGGSFIEEPYKIRTSYRYAIEPNVRLDNIGFRLAE